MVYADILELNRRQPRRTVTAREQTPTLTPMTGAASFLAYLGAAPLLAAALTLVGDPANAVAESFITLYGATLLVFFGGVRWGVAVMKPAGPTMRALLGAALPMIAALPLFAAGGAQMKMLAVMALMIVLLIDDLNATRRGAATAHQPGISAFAFRSPC